MFTKNRPMTKVIFNWRQWLSWSLLAATVAALVIIGYSWSRTRNLLSGPALTVKNPAKIATVFEPLIKIEGEVRRVDHLNLNGGKIFADSQGRFSEQLLLHPGYNIIKLEASDRFGRRVARFLELAYQPKNF